MTDSPKHKPIILTINGMNGIKIIQEFQGILDETSSFLNDSGSIVGTATVQAVWKYYIIPRMGGFEKMEVLDFTTPKAQVDLVEYWHKLSGGPYGILWLEREHPNLTMRRDTENNPAWKRAYALDAESYTADYDWDWLCNLEMDFDETHPDHHVFMEYNKRQSFKRSVKVPKVGGVPERTVDNVHL